MPEDTTPVESDVNVLALQARWAELRVADVFDALDKAGYPNQCLDLDIKPLFENQTFAGRAVTVRGSRDPIPAQQLTGDKKFTTNMLAVQPHIYPGCVIVLDTGGETILGKIGEMAGWRIKSAGAKGVVVDSYMRDRMGLKEIPDFVPCGRGTSCIEAAKRWRVHSVNEPILMPGTLSRYVQVKPGDWIVGGPDGIVVIPEEISMDILKKADEINRKEAGMRKDLRAGMPFEKAYEKWGRS